ncbi:YdcF family protein [Lactiplantibacillus fabifermentans]|uniref:Integral membrane protein n=2 Tax=Lactiplantibacillus fabifermentans TaxID=483011 RepID=A0A0R2NIB2_9LACO|nr:YdcF family protein [Lactiplantibacillus fabifermentans]ETY73135.1 membrane protein [Lactiplantibacillus fabifermentans T30PCM01]KRO25527.1 integral membrane protein [Lactiplantibacillus fabifermentans DSM 21115]
MSESAVGLPIPAAAYYAWIIPFVFGLIFIFRYQRVKARLSNGIWFSLFFYSFLALLAMTILGTYNFPLIVVCGTLFLIILGIIGVLFVLQAFLLIWNGWIMWRRESHTLANMLTLILGLAILILPFLAASLSNHLPQAAQYFMSIFPNLVILYVLFWFYNYLTMLVIYQFNWPRHNQDYIIVLGAGLLNGDRVSPLLAQRIMRGVKFYQKQQRKKQHPAIMIFSGGQGPDETVPEGQAMLDYAIAHGLPAEAGWAETKSKTTYENMLFSRRLIDGGEIKDPNVIFVTNNYHTFRAGMYARQAGLRADGIGAHTARFFLPDAIIREYIAIFMRHKWWHAIALVGIFGISLLGVWLQFRVG